MTIEIPQRLARQLAGVAKARNIHFDRLVLQHLKALVPKPLAKQVKEFARADLLVSPLVDLDWMDGYCGQSADELLAFENHERVDLLALAFAEGIREKIQKTGSWTGVERTVVAVMALDRAVQNDGFDGFFRNASQRHAPAIVDDLERIGCRAIAHIAQKARDALGVRPLTIEAIETAMNRENRKRDRIFSQCDIAFHKRSEIPKRVIAYIKGNRGGIHF